MRLAIAHWQGRISPVLDVAGALLLVDIEHDQERSRQSVTMEEDGPLLRAKRIGELGVATLICGAVSWPLELALTSAGIEVISQCCGEIDKVIEAFLTGQLQQETFLMPGCCRRRRRFRRGDRAGTRRQCICPQCGYQAAHQAGQPFNKQRCPQCGTSMRRG